MFLILGLGNPGKIYQNTKHNLGFLVTDFLAKEFDLATYKKDKTLQAEIATGKITGQKIILAKPQTYMNLSGLAAQKISAFYKIKPANIIVIHDDFDLPFGRFKISYDASAAGHKGVASIIKQLKTQKFIRIRVGIRNPDYKKGAEEVVLKKLSASEKNYLKQILPKITEAVKTILTDDIAKAMSLYNKK
jgi:peptidyl-tRNA hydrolase, PTH1 family